MRAFILARKQLIEILREPAFALFTILFPVFFLVLSAFSYGAPFLRTHPLLIHQEGTGGQGVIGALRAARYPDGRAVFRVELIDDLEAGMQALQDRTATVMLELEHVPPAPLQVTVYGDAVYGLFFRASVLLDEILYAQADLLAARSETIRMDHVQTSLPGARSEFDVYAPGMIVFALLMLVPQTATLLGRELRWGTLRRLRLSRMTALEIFMGIGLAQLIVAALQVIVVFMAARVLGYESHGSFPLAMLVGLVIAISAIGQGLALACFIENDSQAVNLGSSVSMLQVFLSGAFFALPALTLFDVMGHEIDVFDFVPAKHGMLALQMVLNDGLEVGQIAFRLGAALGLALVTFAIGVWVFQRKKLS